MMDAFFRACLEANREIYLYIQDGLREVDLHKSFVGAGGDISSGIDLKAEAIFTAHLSSFGTIESEESGTIGSGKDTVVIDPLDGSSNILSNFPYYGTSVAFVDSTSTTTKAVISNLATGDIFFKKIGHGPQYGKLQKDRFVDYALGGADEIGLFERAYAHPDVVDKLGSEQMKFRAPGAVALSLVYARYASFFLYIGEQRAYDFEAGLLFCEDMEVVVKDEYVIVSKDKKTIEKIELMVVSEGRE